MSRIRADRYTNRAGTGAPTFADGVNVVGITSVKAGAGVTTLEVTGDLSVISGTIKGASELSISGITSSISDTAVDVFVYDTRKDSDGGAWRKRTQNTSWYNETLNTSTRGSRKEFPAVAVIVAESLKVTIYDGDDPDLPLWMVFNVKTAVVGGTEFDMISGGTGTVAAESVFMLNGILSVALSASDGTSAGLPVINFISDSSINYRNLASSFTGAPYRGNISQRNDGLGNSPDTNARAIAAGSCNDVAMTVLPNAPIDSATGLPVPTIAVATDGGTSIIKDDGNVADLTGFAPVGTIHIDESSVIGSVNTGGNDYLYKTTIPTADTSYNTAITAGSNNYYMDNITGTTPTLRYRNVSDTAYNSKDDTLYRGGNNGFDAIKAGQAVSNNVSNSIISYITSNYNTGWMHGDIKGAFLSGISTANVTGSELITNPGPNFSNTNGWGATNGTLSISSGDLLLTGANNVNEHMYSSGFTLTSGKTYVLNIDSNQLFSYVRIGTTTALATGEQLDTSIGAELKSYTFTATASGTFYLKLGMVTSYVTGSINSVSLRLAELDRSVNNKGLQVFGTVTKSAVATGADLVAYSGWSSSNYLEQPYNSDLNFTNEMSIMLWVKDWVAATSLLHRGPNQTRNSKTSFYLYNDSTFDYRFTLSSNGSTEQNFEIQLSANQIGWQQLCFTLSGGTVRGFLNGEEKVLPNSTFTGGNIFSQATDQNGLWIGRGPVSGVYPENADIALLRLSASVPSPEQVKKMYEDEKFLFQENAKATLYGSSDAVTALAYDDTTELLHAGTSAGRSEFQGLRRINNTTTAVTTAISASNELVAEQ